MNTEKSNTANENTVGRDINQTINNYGGREPKISFERQNFSIITLIFGAITLIALVVLAIGALYFNNSPTVSSTSNMLAPRSATLTPTVPMNSPALHVGDTWTENGIEITLQTLEANEDRIFGDWEIRNTTNESMPCSITTAHFSAIDNFGNSLRVIGIGGQYSIPSPKIEAILQPNGRIIHWLAIEFDKTYSSARTVRIIVDDICTVRQAIWETTIDF